MPQRSNPERTDSPTYIRPNLPADHDPLHLAAAIAALDQDRGGGACVGRIAVSPLEQALVGLGILSGISTSGGRPVQLGVRRDRPAGAAATAARCRTSVRNAVPWRHRERARRRSLRIGCVGCHRGRDRRPSGDADSAAQRHRSRYPRTAAAIRRLHHSATDRSSHQPAVSRFMGARRRRAIERARRRPDRDHGRSDRRHARFATHRHRAVAGPEGDRRRLRDLWQSRIHLRLQHVDGALRRVGTAVAREQAHRSRSQRRQAGSRRHHRPGVAPQMDIPSATLPQSSKARPKAPLSSCSIISRATRGKPRRSEWLYNYPDIRTAD